MTSSGIHETLLVKGSANTNLGNASGGRYLTEYRAVRKARKISFLFAQSRKSQWEVTLQPIKRFDFDAAIIFSDILMVPWAQIEMSVSSQE